VACPVDVAFRLRNGDSRFRRLTFWPVSLATCACACALKTSTATAAAPARSAYTLDNSVKFIRSNSPIARLRQMDADPAAAADEWSTSLHIGSFARKDAPLSQVE